LRTPGGNDGGCTGGNGEEADDDVMVACVNNCWTGCTVDTFVACWPCDCDASEGPASCPVGAGAVEAGKGLTSASGEMDAAVCAFTSSGDDIACEAAIDDRTASETAGDCDADAMESSAACPDIDAADESIGLGADTEGCVRLGDDVTADNWSCEDCVVDIDIDDSDAIVPFEADEIGGTAVTECVAFDVPLTNAAVVVVVVGSIVIEFDDEFTAAAAAVAYRKGSAPGGFGGNPFFTMLAIGADAKFGFGGGFDASVVAFRDCNVAPIFFNIGLCSSRL